MLRTTGLIACLFLLPLMAVSENTKVIAKNWAIEKGIGDVQLQVTSKSPQATQAFAQGLALLENFEFDSAALSFQQAQQFDSSFAMAYWGEATTHLKILWFSLDFEPAEDIYDKMDKVADLKNITPLEIQLIAATRTFLKAKGRSRAVTDQQGALYQYRLALKHVYEAYPKQPDVATLYALAILGTRYGISDFDTNALAGQVAQANYADFPEHPGLNHMILHSYENSTQYYLAKAAAQRYSQVAPGSIHGLHMPSHYYYYKGDWAKLIELNDIAWAQSLERQKAMNLTDDALEYHGYLWGVYARIQLGLYYQAAEAIQLVASKMETSTRNNYLSAMMSHYLLATANKPGLRDKIMSIKFDESLLGHDYQVGYWYANVYGQGKLDKLSSIIQKIEQEILPNQEKDAPTVIAEVDIMYQQLKALNIYYHGDKNAALAQLKQIAQAEDEAFREHGVPMIVKPSHELLGDLYLQTQRYGEAAIEFQKELFVNKQRKHALDGLCIATHVIESGHSSAACVEISFPPMQQLT